jgi:hypothetical protein
MIGPDSCLNLKRPHSTKKQNKDRGGENTILELMFIIRGTMFY